MQLARVIGAVVSTHKNAALQGAKLLLVQPVEPNGRPHGQAVVAVDGAQAGVGQQVLLVLEGRAATAVVRRRTAPVDAAVIGIVDDVSVT